MKMKSDRSQITMIMIIGIIIVALVGFFLYIVKSSVSKQSQQIIKKVQETQISVEPIKDFVAKCLDKLSKDAIVLLAS